uniref:Uncharacterized protein n=1 Tax=Plectus sambesii TaxID=2011161 RepID=A0A914W988_9BILA
MRCRRPRPQSASAAAAGRKRRNAVRRTGRSSNNTERGRRWSAVGRRAPPIPTSHAVAEYGAAGAPEYAYTMESSARRALGRSAGGAERDTVIDKRPHDSIGARTVGDRAVGVVDGPAKSTVTAIIHKIVSPSIRENRADKAPPSVPSQDPFMFIHRKRSFMCPSQLRTRVCGSKRHFCPSASDDKTPGRRRRRRVERKAPQKPLVATRGFQDITKEYEGEKCGVEERVE